MRSTLMMSIPRSVVSAGGWRRGAPLATSEGRVAGERSALPDSWFRGIASLLDGDGLGEVARLVDVGASRDGDVVREELERDDPDDRPEDLVGVRDEPHVIRIARDL